MPSRPISAVSLAGDPPDLSVAADGTVLAMAPDMAACRVHPSHLILPTLAAAAYFLAQGTTALIGSRLALASDLPRSPVAPAPLRRDGRGELSAPWLLPSMGLPRAPAPVAVAPGCGHDAPRLVGTVVDRVAEARSTAAVWLGADRRTVRIGDSLGERVVAAIGTSELTLTDESDRSCRISLHGEPSRGTAPAQ